MKIYILGICGTFMGGVAVLAKSLGHEVYGADQNIYPPMSTMLERAGIRLLSSFDVSHLDEDPDLVIVGNAISRGNPVLEAVLARGLDYVSGPEWLQSAVLKHREVIAVSGTHGKTTTTSLLAWILRDAEIDAGFLIGGVSNHFSVSAELGTAPYFVIEADEYDTAFYDKRSKFLHYRPKRLIINNLEFDHADIFKDLSDIQSQFHVLLKMLPDNGTLIVPKADQSIKTVLDQGCWTKVQTVGEKGTWKAKLIDKSGRHFEVFHEDYLVGEVRWPYFGLHMVHNALMAIAAAHSVGVPMSWCCRSLGHFLGVKRRMIETKAENGVRVFDDFAHHPTAIRVNLQGLRQFLAQDKQLLLVLDFASNTMKRGDHVEQLPDILNLADHVCLLSSDALTWDINALADQLNSASIHTENPSVVNSVRTRLSSGDAVVVMSNKNTEVLCEAVLASLK